MKKIFIVLFILVVAACVYLWVEGRELQEIRTEIDIAAPPEKVWAFIENIESWGEWSPIINHASGDAVLGSTLSVTMVSKRQGQNGPTYNPKIIHFDEPNYFHWRAVMLSGVLMTNDKVFELERTASGTRLVHKELFKGMLVPIFCSNFEENVPAMLDSMNQALKTLVE